ncbi:MAG: AraC family transcriptional regulator, partial [Eubacteriales bacterium]|nr:AraC family transcriptional regulator [Eubacteriales bacterium]
NFEFHVHDRCEMFYFVSGSAEYLVEGSVYPLASGSLMIMRPGEAHCIRMLKKAVYERYAVNFPLSIFDSFDSRRILMKPYTERELGKGNLFSLSGQEAAFAEMCDDSLDDYTRGVVITAKLAGLLETILREFGSSARHTSAEKTIAEEVVAYVNRHIFGELSLTMLAEHFYLSKSQLCRIFKQTTGAAPWDYITVKRLIAAKTMIANGATAKAAAESCGFCDYSVFYRAYVKRFKQSPSGKPEK